MGVFIDILGKRFGKLVAIERISDGSYGKWKFKCDCGQEKIISKQNVTQGKVKSCGCLNKERGLEQRLSLIGRHFGSLEIIGFNNCDLFQGTFWKCKCQCGKEIIVKGSNLVKFINIKVVLLD